MPDQTLIKFPSSEVMETIQKQREAMMKEVEKIYMEPLAGDGFEVEVSQQDLTCAYCLDKDTCDCAWDLYNTDGDCLKLK